VNLGDKVGAKKAPRLKIIKRGVFRQVFVLLCHFAHLNIRQSPSFRNCNTVGLGVGVGVLVGFGFTVGIELL
jgi:hypothetical protein